ncbi:MAG: hypothetical protein IJP50_04585 [Paludibacteraceae bacterium]|nr:hypothetical protein [Paludibacteraceae bacterium]
MYKSELADAAGVSLKTFGRWLKRDRDYFASVGVSIRQKMLPPIAVKYICEKYVIEL